jgi:hypothetical protein
MWIPGGNTGEQLKKLRLPVTTALAGRTPVKIIGLAIQ